MPPPRTCSSARDFHFVDVHVGARRRRRRELLGISQTQLARAAGVSFQLIQKNEASTTRISPSRLCAYARVLAVDAGWFFDGLPPTETGRTRITVSESELRRPETASLIEAYLRIAPERRRAVSRLIKIITEGPPG